MVDGVLLGMREGVPDGIELGKVEGNFVGVVVVGIPEGLVLGITDG